MICDLFGEYYEFGCIHTCLGLKTINVIVIISYHPEVNYCNSVYNIIIDWDRIIK